MEGHGTVIMDIVEVVEVMEEQENGVVTGMVVVGVTQTLTFCILSPRGRGRERGAGRG